MSNSFHSSPFEWLDLSLTEMNRWAMAARRMAEKEAAKHNVQQIGPGL